MDYEKEYKDALERARKGMPMSEVFPELKESEDERIIGNIKKAVELYWSDEPLYEILSWLEKQKEQKPSPLFKVGDRIKFKSKRKYPFREIIDIKDGAYYFDAAVHLPFKEQDKWEAEQKPAE